MFFSYSRVCASVKDVQTEALVDDAGESFCKSFQAIHDNDCGGWGASRARQELNDTVVPRGARFLPWEL